MATEATKIPFVEAAAPSTPAASRVVVYAKADGLMYSKDDAGVETLMSGGSSGAVATDSIWDAKGDLAGGTGANTAAKLTVGTNGFVLTADSGETTGLKWAAASGGSTPVLRLDYNLAADISNQAITAGSFFDLFANQNFTVGSASSLIEVSVRGYGFLNDGVSAQQSLFRCNIDSAGTPVLKYFSSASNNVSSVDRDNLFAGGVVYISGLSAATHTLKMQYTVVGANDHLYCRASTNGPTTGGEFLAVQVVEHL